MKIINRIIGLCVALFLFFTFSNYNSIGDIVEAFSVGQPDRNEAVNESSFEKAIVHKVIDGDTIKVEFSGGKIETVRLLLIDTPESVKPKTPVMPFGEEASNFMKKTLIKGTVIEIEKGIEERDKYGRLLAYVWADGKNINKELLKKGLARVAYVQSDTKYLEEFKKAEEKAKKERKGIWSLDGYVTEDGFNYP